MEVMANYKICRLCFQSVLLDNVQNISELQTEILEVLLIKVDLSVSEEPLICLSCWEQLQKNFNFKSKCIETEDFLTPLLERGKIMDLSDMVKNSMKTENDENHTVCRLCMKVTAHKCELTDSEENIFRKFLPEINLDTCLSLIICSMCYDSLQNYFSFALKCLCWEDKLKQYLKLVSLRKKRKFCLENFHRNLDKLIKLEKDNNNDIALDKEEFFSVATNDIEINIKHEIMELKHSSDGSEVNEEYAVQGDYNSSGEDQNSLSKNRWKCTQCSFESGSKYYVKIHELMHKGIRKEYKKKTQEFKCSICSFVTNSKHYLKKHELMHNGGGKKFRCPECPLKTVYKECLLKHIKTVHNPEPQLFMCNDCDFKTKHKISIIRHVEIHRPKDVLACKFCNFRTRIPKTLEVHKCKKKKQPRKFPCDICNHTFTRARSFNEHRRLVHNIGEQEFFKCELCGFFTKRKSTLRKHLRAHDKKSKSALYKCPHCEFKTFETHCLKKHFYIHQNNMKIDIKECVFEKHEVKKEFKCSQCDAAFVRQNTLLRHQFVHSEDKPFKCNLCSFRTKSQKNLDGHKNVHKECLFKCGICEFKTKTNTLLKIHMIKHESGPKLYKCKLCSFQSKWKVSYSTHIAALHLGKLFSCDKCDFKTAHRRTIISHRLIHDKDNLPLLKCNECNFTTKRKDSMRFHQLVHKAPTEVKMFKCTECPFESKYRRSLRNHIRDIHENKNMTNIKNNLEKTDVIKKFKCPKCPFRSSLMSNLNKHLDGKHGNEIFNCEKCSYTTNTNHKLKSHQNRMHTDFELLKCNLCEFQTRYKKSLKNHMSNIHEQWEVLEKNDHKQIKRKDF